MKKITEQQLIGAVTELFAVSEKLHSKSDLSVYVKDSIDLGELIAVLKEQQGVTPQSMEFFKTHVALDDILSNFNHELKK